MAEEENIDRLLEQALAAAGGAVSRPCRREHDLAAWLDGTLGPAERESLEDHLAGCESCRLALSMASESLRETDPEPLPHSWLAAAESLFTSGDRAKASAAGVAGEGVLSRWWRRAFTWPRLASAGAIAITVGLTIAVLTHHPAPQVESVSLQALKAPVRELDLPAAPGPKAVPPPPADGRLNLDVARGGGGPPASRRQPETGGLVAPGPQRPALQDSAAGTSKRREQKAMEDSSGAVRLASPQPPSPRPDAVTRPAPAARAATIGPPGTVLSLDSVEIVGRYDQGLVEDRALGQLGKISSCYQDRRTENKDTRDALVAKFVITADGRLTGAGEDAAGALDDCVRESLSAYSWPEPTGGGSVAVSLRFSAP